MASLEVRTNAGQILDVSVLSKHVEDGLVNKQKHPIYDLWIYNYSPKAQFEKEWTKEMRLSRGLILDRDMNVIARPFEKFFNINTAYMPETMLENLPKEVPELTEKMDGSMGVLYTYLDQTAIATRGSFTSEQSQWATNWYKEHQKRAELWEYVWPEGWTPIFEIIYKENRIVVEYDFEGLVLLGLVNNETGEYMPHEQVQFWAKENKMRCVQLHTVQIEDAMKENTENREGYVASYSNGLKVKIKFEDYCRLHRILTGLNPKDLWEHWTEGKLCDLHNDESLPKSFREWAAGWCGKFETGYVALEDEAKFIFNTSVKLIYPKYGGPNFHPDQMKNVRKDFALFFQAQSPNLTGVLFAMLDGKNHKPIIEKMLKPKATDTFKEEK
jgi:T4 RnlA family RNA ligase